jgi:predicted nucleic acid-binding Zn ribbon protein
MPNCTKCGTWNPDDKRVCWRCQTPLPKPTPQKQRRSSVLWGLPIWAWVVLALMLAFSVLGQCGGLQNLAR